MNQHESGVNYQNLIRDLADMYPADVAEVIVVELIANALDAKATVISVDYDNTRKVLVIQDNGNGMSESQFKQYHDFAAGLKTRGQGIGFAGVGAKISFNIAKRVVTETKSQSFTGGSDWYFLTEKKLVWDDIAVSQLKGQGTRVEVHFQSNAPVAYDDLTSILKRNYLPLLDKQFLKMESDSGFYSVNTRFIVNGLLIEPGNIVEDYHLSNVLEFFPKRSGKLFGYGILGLAPSDYPLGPESCGVSLCTHGKVIKADLFNQFPGEFGPRIFGLVEVPAFIEFLTTSKTDFYRRSRRREFEELYNPIRSEFRSWLAELGVRAAEDVHDDAAPQLERVLRQLVDDVPELGDFLGIRDRKSVLVQSDSDSGSVPASVHEGVEVTFPDGDGDGTIQPGPLDIGDQQGESLGSDASGDKKAKPISRQGRRGPRISFAESPEAPEMAWVNGNTIIINSGHPAYIKARANPTQRTLHSLYAIGIAVQRFLSEGSEKPDVVFVDRMMAAWARR